MSINKFLANLNGAKIVSLRTKTDVKMLAASRQKFPKGISKIAVRNGIIGASYENAVNNQLEREEKLPEFQAESLWKGKGRSVSSFLVEHCETKEQYLKFLPKTNSIGNNITKSIYVDNATGLEIEQSEFSEFMPKGGYSVSNVQGTEKEIKWQVIAIKNVIGIKCGELEYSSN